jgi:hypothetical protein
MNGPAWLEELQALVARFAERGVGPDLAALTMAELWGVYMFLRAVAERGG